VGRDDDIRAIVELGRRTRKPTPRWLWLAATVIGAICAVCFTAMMLGDRERPGGAPRPPASHEVEQGPAAGSGLGIGLLIGTGVGIVIGFSIGRQRRSHSSRKRP
jgi:hypothetical protein